MTCRSEMTQEAKWYISTNVAFGQGKFLIWTPEFLQKQMSRSLAYIWRLQNAINGLFLNENPSYFLYHSQLNAKYLRMRSLLQTHFACSLITDGLVLLGTSLHLLLAIKK